MGACPHWAADISAYGRALARCVGVGKPTVGQLRKNIAVAGSVDRWSVGGLIPIIQSSCQLIYQSILHSIY